MDPESTLQYAHGCKYCEKVMVHTGSIDAHLRTRRKTDPRGSRRLNAPKRHHVRRMSSLGVKAHMNPSDITDIIHIAQTVSSLTSGVQSKCGICALDLRYVSRLYNTVFNNRDFPDYLLRKVLLNPICY